MLGRMKTARVDARSRAARKSSRHPGWQALPFKAFIAYAHVGAARQAMSTITDVLRAAHRPYEFVPMLWRFEQLRGGRLRETALADSMDADVVVFASPDSRSLPGFVEKWIGEFLLRKRGTRVNAVALLGEHEAWTIAIEPAVGARLPAPVMLAAPPTLLAEASRAA